ncbi:hypothetical protein BSK49_03775 [Paenibacillus odorifer]|nr:hypothetical protein BSK49_03775 [Paenibacillus odorifer]
MSTLTLVPTPPLARLSCIAKETVTADTLDAAPLIAKYAAAIEDVLATTSRRDLVVNIVPPDSDNAKAARVQHSKFWEAVETMGQRLDYVIENNDRSAVKAAAWARTREEWAELERDYIGYPPLIHEDDAEPNYCAAWDCHRSARRRSIYCCDRCRNEQKAAKLRFETTGTYLPRKAYESVRNAYEDKATGSHTVGEGAAAMVGADGHNYRLPVRRKLTDRELTDMEMKRAEAVAPGEVIRYNLAAVDYYIDERGHYHISQKEIAEMAA